MKRWNFSIDTVERICNGAILLLAGMAIGVTLEEPKTVETIQYVETEPEVIREVVEVEVPKVVTVTHTEKVERMPEVVLNEAEKIVIAKVVMAEAGYEDMIGKRLVVDTILNRVDRGYADSVFGVVYAEGQYYKASFYTEECMHAVEMECMERLDRRVLWFSSDGWMPYGEHAYQHGGHYFSWGAAEDE